MRIGALLATAFWLVGCASTPEPAAPPPALASKTAITPALRVAADLAAAEQAEVAGDTAALFAAVARLSNRGVQPLDPSAEAILARWSGVAGVRPAPLRGRALGPGFRRGTLAPRESRALEQLFLAGKPAEISLQSNSTPGLRLTLRDAKARIVCNHDPASGRSCRFTPIFSQRYGIEIANGGQGDASYFLVFD